MLYGGCYRQDHPADVGAEDERLLRLLIRLASVYDYPRTEFSPEWADTGGYS